MLQNSFAGQTVLVTGADGFIGSHLVEALVAQGAHVKALAQYNSFNSWGWLDTVDAGTMAAVEVISGDIRDPFLVKHAMQGCSTVFHLAALIAIPYSYLAPQSYIETNINGTLNVVQAARELDTARVVVTSTSEVYGTARQVPITEEHPLQGQSPYSASKIGADQIALSFHKSFGTPVVVLRPFNTYGPRQSARAVIPTIISQLANAPEELRLGALHPTRDFTFVKDTARGFMEIARCDAAVGEVVNIGSDFEISIGDLAACIADLMGVKTTITTDSQRLRPKDSEVERLWAGIDKARGLFGWEPAYGGLEGFRRGLLETIEWFREPTNLARYKHGIYNV